MAVRAPRAPRKSKSKYAHVIDKLPKLFNLDAEYNDRIAKMQAVIVAETTAANVKLDAATLAYIYEDFRQTKDEIEAELHEANLKLEAISKMVENEFDAQGMTSVKLAHGASVRMQKEPQATVVDKEKFRLWCLANGYADKLQLHWSTTNSIAKERLLEGDPEPDGVELNAITKIVFTGA